jgi:hypothetical protein
MLLVPQAQSSAIIVMMREVCVVSCRAYKTIGTSWIWLNSSGLMIVLTFDIFHRVLIRCSKGNNVANASLSVTITSMHVKGILTNNNYVKYVRNMFKILSAARFLRVNDHKSNQLFMK